MIDFKTIQITYNIGKKGGITFYPNVCPNAGKSSQSEGGMSIIKTVRQNRCRTSFCQHELHSWNFCLEEMKTCPTLRKLKCNWTNIYRYSLTRVISSVSITLFSLILSLLVLFIVCLFLLFLFLLLLLVIF